MDITNYSKESIKARMLEQVAALWDIRHADNLDPVVKLLVEALASEIFKLSGEVANIESRILEKLARAFTLSYMLSAFPAHSVVHGRVSKEGCVLGKKHEFIYKDASLVKKYNLRRLVFSPTAEVRLIDAEIVHMITDGKFYNVHPVRGRDHVGNASGRNPLFNGAVWICVDGKIPDDLKNTSFFFGFPFLEQDTSYYDLLSHTRWFAAGKELRIGPGLPELEINGDNPDSDRFDEMRMLDKEVNDYYRSRFVHITGPTGSLEKEIFPAELNDAFEGSFRDGYKEPRLWIKIVFPPVFTSKVLSNITVSLNCLPVSNKFRRSVMQEISSAAAIIPLEKEDSEYFLAVDSVTDSHNIKYSPIRGSGKKPSSGPGTYGVRRGGCERFNSIDARQYLIHLLDLLRDESVAFSSMNKDMLEKNVNSLLVQLNVLENKLNLKQDNRENISYLILDYNGEDKVNVTARYFLTNGEIGNGIGVGEVMANTETLLAEVASVSFMTVTRGGKESPNVSRQMDMYKYMLQSHGGIYTPDDIAAYCKSIFGDYFSELQVTKGYAVGKRPGQGVIRMTDIHLGGVSLTQGTRKEELAQEIVRSLTDRSPDEMNYRVIFK